MNMFKPRGSTYDNLWPTIITILADKMLKDVADLNVEVPGPMADAYLLALDNDKDAFYLLTCHYSMIRAAHGPDCEQWKEFIQKRLVCSSYLR